MIGGDREARCAPVLCIGPFPPSGFRYASPERRAQVAEGDARLELLLESARMHGIAELWFRPEKRLWKETSRGRAFGGFQVIPIVPNVAGFVRDVSAYGTAGAGIRRFLDASPSSKARMIRFGLPSALRILGREFPALLRLLLVSDLGELGALEPKQVYLDGLATDLLLAFGRIDVLDEIRDFVATRFGADLGLHTRNVGLLLRELDRCGSNVQAVLGPIHADGFAMRPDQASCLAALSSTRRDISIEVLLDVPAMNIPDELACWLSLDVKRIAVCVITAEDVERFVDGIATAWGGGSGQRQGKSDYA